MFDKRKDSPESTPDVPRDVVTDSTTSRSTAVIGKTIKIKGSITGDENLVIEGTVDGSVDLPKNDLTIGQSGQVKANLNGNTVRVDGQVSGDINGTEKVIITKTGKVEGNIIAPRVTLEDGAKFKGSIDMDPGETASKPAAVKAATSADSEGDVKAAG